MMSIVEPLRYRMFAAIGAMTLSILLSAPSIAQEGDGEVLEPVLVELPSLLAPIFSSNGRVRTYLNLSLSVELHPEVGLEAGDVKTYIPRFQDIIVRHLHRNPMPRHPDDDSYWLEEVGRRITPEIEAVFQRIILAPVDEDDEPNPKIVKGMVINLF